MAGLEVMTDQRVEMLAAEDAYSRFFSDPESITQSDIDLLESRRVLAHAAEERSLDAS